ncbi:nucleotidyltransferase family protein [Hydrogenovibrio sp. JE_KL2]|uniref:nucleotidyltransferase family protein n=1 Tax=Hydrogenovibrio sp. JE_KL2 TaxID=2651188 RepID=UPI00128C62E9|nr:nucleotidyltransferase family protein [Hydrogenovibrio sp. JE_KL2]MPQ75461.1 NTP transferase domain-containing protein [Hydrogenovibrio sp. JE_KL2]
MVKIAIILAGGQGTRLRSVVSDVPKPMAPINNRPFLEYQMDYWINQGVEQFVISVGYKKEVIIDYFGENYKTAKIHYVVEDTPLGTGGGFLLAIKDINESCLLLNGDTFFEVDLPHLEKFHNEHASDWTMSLFRTNESGRYMGLDVDDDDGKIVSLESGTDKVGRLANGGVYLCNPSFIKAIGQKFVGKVSLEDDLMPKFIEEKGRLFGEEFSGCFIDIGVPDDYYRASSIL